jgi:hypothetical protein
MPGLTYAIAGALLLAALSTAYDFIWAYFAVEHRPLYGLVHGTTLLAAAGLVLGWGPDRRMSGAAGGALAGLLAAAAFYGLVVVTGFIAALVGAWMLLWLLFAALRAWLEPGAIMVREVVLRGGAAAVASGLVFWLISGIWTRHDAVGPNYAWNFAAWTLAYLPGFLALLMGARVSSAARRPR